MQKTRISAFPTIKLAFLGVFIAVVLLPTTIDHADAAHWTLTIDEVDSTSTSNGATVSTTDTTPKFVFY